jgi:hypothetical protein
MNLLWKGLVDKRHCDVEKLLQIIGSMVIHGFLNYTMCEELASLSLDQLE